MRKYSVILLAAAIGFSGMNSAHADEAWPPAGQQKVIAPVRSFHEHIKGDGCKLPPEPFNTEQDGDRAWRLPPLEHTPSRTDTPRHIVRMFCGFGAYNVFHNWYLAEADDRIVQIFFSEPHFDIEYARDAHEIRDESKALAIHVKGFSANDGVYNSRFEPETQIIIARFRARGQGDAFSEGEWKIEGKQVFLQLHAADVTIDGKMNPVVVFDASTNEPIRPLPASPSIKE